MTLVFITTTTRMAPRHPTELNLDDAAYEEDIGDGSPYLAIPSSTSSRASSSTSFSDASSPRTLPTDDEYDIPIGSAMSPDVLDTPTNIKFSVQLPSPSSPSLATFSGRPFQIERAATLPDDLHTEKKRSTVREIQEELRALPRDNASIANMRRWIMGIAVGEWHTYHSHNDG